MQRWENGISGHMVLHDEFIKYQQGLTKNKWVLGNQPLEISSVYRQ